MSSTWQRYAFPAVAMLSFAAAAADAFVADAVAGQPAGRVGSPWNVIVTPAQSAPVSAYAEQQAASLYSDAQAYLNLREWSAAKRILQAIIDQHPGTAAATRAGLDLARIEAEVFSPSQRFSLGGPELLPGPDRAPVGGLAPAPSAPVQSDPPASSGRDPLEWLLGSQPLQDKFRADVGDRIFFSAHSAALGQRGTSVLGNQARWLQDNPATEVRIEAHADEPGADDNAAGVALNERVARARGEAVRDVIVRAGVDPARVTIEVVGRTRRVAVCDSAACRAQNRRVVLRVTPATRQVGAVRPKS